MWIKTSPQNEEEYSFPETSDFIRLNLNESAYAMPDWLKLKILSRLKKAHWHYYPSDNNLALLSRLADYTGYQPEGILLGNGSNELIQTVVYACCRSGDTVLTVRPGFSIYKNVAKLMNIKVKEVPLRDDLSFDTESLLQSARKAQVVFLTSPHNPTGFTLSSNQVEKISVVTKGLVVVDEAYAEFSGETSVPLLFRHDNLLILRTFSKAFRLAGGRFGYLVGQPGLIKALKAARLPFSVGIFQQIAAEILLEEKDFILKEIQKIVAERERLFNLLKTCRTFKPFPSQANFLLVESSLFMAEEIYTRLFEKKILVRVFSSPELRRRFRITVGQPEENNFLIKALREIEQEILDVQKG